jgi:hypothetical protein
MTFAFAILLILAVAVTIVAWNEHRRVGVWQDMWRTVSAQLARRDTRVAHLEYENQELQRRLAWWRGQRLAPLSFAPDPLAATVTPAQVYFGSNGGNGGPTGEYKPGPVEYWAPGGGGEVGS